MRAVRLTIKNVGIIGNTVIELNKPLIMFFGDLRQGKTTILNAFKWCLGGSFPTDIIKHGETEAAVIFEFQEETGPGSIFRSWYKNKEGVTTPRPVSFIRAGKPVSKPDNEIKKFLNPYLLDNNFLKEMGETERKSYFVSLFGVDTSDVDKEINTAAESAKVLRIEIKAYGEIDLIEVKSVDMTALKAQRAEIIKDHEEKTKCISADISGMRTAYDSQVQKVNTFNRAVFEHNGCVTSWEDDAEGYKKEISELLAKLQAAKINLGACEKWLSENNRQVEKEKPIAPDTTALEAKLREQPDTDVLDAKISEAAVVAVKVEQYQKNLKRAEEKKDKEKKLSENETKQRDLKKKKVARLAEAGTKSGIEGLTFNEDGSFTYKGTSAGMLSTSQIGELSQELSALYPIGFGLDLIDRAESLGFAIGKNILEFVEKAKREEKTILAAIVGERPAEAPPEVGVFVVEKGEIKS